MFGVLSCGNQVSLVSVCAKFQPPSMSRISWTVCGWVVWWGGLVVITVSNLNPSCIELELGLGFDNWDHSRIKIVPKIAWIAIIVCCVVVTGKQVVVMVGEEGGSI